MRSLLSGIFKLIFGSFLFGLVLLANPIEVNAIGQADVHSGSISGTTPYNATFFRSGPTFNVADNQPLTQYGLVPFSSFDINVAYLLKFMDFPQGISIDGYISVDASLLFSAPDGGAYSQPLGTFYFDVSEPNTSFNFSIRSSCEGVPTGIRVKVYDGSLLQSFNFRSIVFDSDGVIVQQSFSDLSAYFQCRCSFTNFSFEQSSGSGSSSTVINNTTSNLVPIGYSSLNFGLNGSTYFLGASRIFDPSYLSPLIFSYDFANSVQGVISSAPLTLAMGGFDSLPNTAHASPIAVIGDTRAGEYELTISLCLSNSPSSAQLSALTNLSNWGFEFNRGYSGQQFSLPSNTRVSYTNFTDSKTGYVYTSVYFYFTTPDYFDSFLIRKAPSLDNIRVGAFAFNKYTGTISDQLTQSNQQWDYQNPSHSSFSSANSSAASTVSAFSSIESDAFSNLDTAMSGAGVNDFNINVISTPLATVSAMINQTYNILPDLVKWLILAILVIGIFAVIISANNYVNKD